MSVAMPSMASRLSLDFTKTLLCHIVTLGHYYGMPPPTPDTLQPPTDSPEGERTAGSRLKKDNNRKKNRNNRRKIGRIAIKIEKK